MGANTGNIRIDMNIQGIPCADNAIDVIYYGSKLHIVFLEGVISIFTDEDIDETKITNFIQGNKKMIDLLYKKKKKGLFK